MGAWGEGSQGDKKTSCCFMRAAKTGFGRSDKREQHQLAYFLRKPTSVDDCEKRDAEQRPVGDERP
jgi:hypothetical protein